MIASKPTRGLTSRILHNEAHRRIVSRQIIMIAEHWDDRYNQAKGDCAGLCAAQPHPQVQQIAGELSHGGGLGLESGDGRNAIWLAHHGWQVTAVEFSAAGLDIGR